MQNAISVFIFSFWEIFENKEDNKREVRLVLFFLSFFPSLHLSRMPSILPTQINEPPQRKFFSKITSTKNHTRHFMAGNSDDTYDKIPLDTNRHHTASALPHHVSLSDNSKFLLCCFMWYICSSLSSNTAKQIMNTFKYPVTLTFVQFLMVSCWCAVMERVFKSSGIKKPTKTIIQTIVPLSSFMIVGHVFSSISISRIPVSLVHTIKVNIQTKKGREEEKEGGGMSKLKSTIGISALVHCAVLSIHL